MSNDAVIREAIKLRDRLIDVGKEIGYRDARTPAAIELRAMDQKTVADAAEMMAKLGREVTRLRLAILHFDHGRMDRFELRGIVKNWNSP